MHSDKKLKEILRRASDRRCVFNEYKEWLGEDIDNEVLAIPTEIIKTSLINKEVPLVNKRETTIY